MNDRQKKPSKIIVGIKLESNLETHATTDDNDAAEMKHLVQSAGKLAQRLGATLRLVCVCETSPIEDITGLPWRPAYRWQRKWLESVFFEYRQELIEKAGKRLRSLAAECALPVDFEVNAIGAAYPYQGILADAVTHSASLILVGAGTKTGDYMTKGFATPLAVMAEATMPVMVLSSRCSIDFSKPKLKVLLADDLREETAMGVRSALDWAARLGAAEILQLHVAKTHEFKQLFDRILPYLKRGIAPNPDAMQSFQEVEAMILQRLRDRLLDFKETHSGSIGSMRQEVREGKDHSEEIARAADFFGADILMFGKYHKVHRRPFLVGRTTYDHLLAQKRPVMVFP